MKCWSRAIYVLVMLCFLPGIGNSQTPNFSEDIAKILYTSCSGCHRPGGVAPFKIMSYVDAYNARNLINNAVTSGLMPPWPPDTTYSRFVHERALTAEEVSMISDWAANGGPRGDSTLAPPTPVFSTGVLGTPDLVLTMPEYTSKASTKDDYICVSLPSGLTTDKVIRAIEIIPGNMGIVHHALVFIDTTGTFDTDTGDCIVPFNSKLATGWVPGAGPSIFPATGSFNMGMTIPAGGNIVLQMHYPLGTSGKKDSTQVKLYFYPDGTPNIREVYANSLLQNWSLNIPANTIQNFSALYPSTGTTTEDLTLLSIFPHMHLLGKTIESRAYTPSDTLPLVKINDWDFDWQGFYTFRNPVKLPIGSQLYGGAVYDNTIANPHNPNNPPVNVNAGLSTTDEMFLVYFLYLPYVTGDENLNMDSLLNVAIGRGPGNGKSGATFSIRPNPFNDMSFMQINLVKEADVVLQVYNLQGQVVRQLLRKRLASGDHTMVWNGKDNNGNRSANGYYICRLQVDGHVIHQKALLMR